MFIHTEKMEKENKFKQFLNNNQLTFKPELVG